MCEYGLDTKCDVYFNVETRLTRIVSAIERKHEIEIWRVKQKHCPKIAVMQFTCKKNVSSEGNRFFAESIKLNLSLLF